MNHRGGCLHPETKIDTPNGTSFLENLEPGDEVYSQDEHGNRITARVEVTLCRQVKPNHSLLKVDAPRGTLFASGLHPVADGSPIEHIYLLSPRFRATELGIHYTCDIAVTGPTNTYWAEGLLLKSSVGLDVRRGD